MQRSTAFEDREQLETTTLKIEIGIPLRHIVMNTEIIRNDHGFWITKSNRRIKFTITNF